MSAKKQPRIEFQPEVPDEFGMLEAMITKTGAVEDRSVTHSVSVRLPTNEFCLVEAIAKHSGVSRNRIILQMIRVSIERLNEELPEVELEAIHALRSELHSQFIAGDLPGEMETI